MIASLSGHLPGGSPLPSWTNPRAPNFVNTSASHLLPSPTCWLFSGQQLRATTKAMATWSLLRSSTSAIHSTLKTIPCWFAFRLIIDEQPRSQALSSLPQMVVGRKTLVAAGHVTTCDTNFSTGVESTNNFCRSQRRGRQRRETLGTRFIDEAFAPVQQLWPQARGWSDLRGWTPCHHNSSVVFFFNFQCKRLDTVLFTLGLKSNSCHRFSSECIKREDFTSDSSITRDHDAIGHFRIVQKLKNRVEAERTSLQFPLYKRRKMKICPLNVDFILLFLHNSTVTYWRESTLGFHIGQIETMIVKKMFKNLFGQSLKSA